MKIVQENQAGPGDRCLRLVPAAMPAALRYRQRTAITLRAACPKRRWAGQVVKEAHVAVGTVAQVKAVDPYVAVGHHAVEGNIDVTVGVSGGQQKALAIPGDSGGEEASGGPLRFFWSTGPAMLQSWGTVTLRQAESSNAACSLWRRVPGKELPACVEVVDDAGSRGTAPGKRPVNRLRLKRTEKRAPFHCNAPSGKIHSSKLKRIVNSFR